jgi:Holliday junction resolvase RusA-like endonuclease
MQQVVFEVPGDPVPKARARTVRKGGRTWSFTPKRVAAWERTIREEAAKHFNEPMEGPVMISLIFHMARPGSRRKEVYVSTTPDLDNLEKAVLDALNGVAYEDDRFVVAKNAQKRYILNGKPRVSVRVTSLNRQAPIEGFIGKKGA